MCTNNLSAVHHHPCFPDEEMELLWECASQSFDRKHMTYSVGSLEESLIKQLFTKVWARVRKSTSDDAVA